MAIKLIIADDEPLVLVGLQSMLKWQELGIEMVAVVRNGLQLQKAIEKEHPDLVITDIKMPIKSGLDVLKESAALHGRLPLFILLTSYEEFTYVKEALTYQAVDYLVKLELTEESLASSVNKALELLKQIKEHGQHPYPVYERGAMGAFRDKFFVRLFNGLIDSRQSFDSQKQELGLCLEETLYVVCYTAIEDKDQEAEISLCYSSTGMLKETLSRYLTCHITSLDLHHMAIVFCLNEEQGKHYRTIIRKVMENALQVIYNYFSVPLLCCVGLPVEDPFHLSDSFASARQLLSTTTQNDPISFAEQKQEQRFKLDAYRSRLTRAFEELDAQELAQVMKDVALQMETQNISSLQAVENTSNILYMAISLLPDGQNLVEQIFLEEHGGYRQIYSYTSTIQCCSYLRQLAEGLGKQLQARKQDYRAKVVANIQQYIQDNITRKLNLGEVALLFGFSQNYLSSLFSRYSDCSFVEYITKEKVHAAKRMLAQGEYKIYEIAEKLGFESSFYFSKVFKKVEGLSPRQYLHHLSRTEEPHCHDSYGSSQHSRGNHQVQNQPWSKNHFS
ncbi:MAG: response regulator transcription factor [Sphaerochaetaceae bacterium]